MWRGGGDPIIDAVRRPSMSPDPVAPPRLLPTLTESQHRVAHRQNVQSGRGWILAVTVIQTLAALFMLVAGMGSPSPEAKGSLVGAAIVMGLLALIYLGLWLWAKRAPFAAALIALVLYVSFLAFDAIVDPRLLFQGIIIKILIIVALAQAVKSGYALRKFAETGA